MNASCIHVSTVENQSIQLDNTKHSYEETLVAPGLQIDSLVYTESLFPLEEFFTKLKSGQYNEAFHKINLNYKPSNIDNRVIAELIKEGLVPVYVNIKNTTDRPIAISEKNFFIYNEENQMPAIKLEDVPKAFVRFNSMAALANVYNVGATVLISAALIVVLGASLRGGGGPIILPNGGSRSSASLGDHSGRADNDILNDTKKTIRINYKNYLIGEKTIEPKQSIQGLLFFHFSPNPSNLHLKFL